jgi:hypothetical protein
MSLDPHHVHNFWGTSPGLDLKELVEAARTSAAAASDQDGDAATDAETKNVVSPLTALLVGTSDPRHILTTLARCKRRGDPDQALHFHVHEANMVETARHILLLCILMTDDLPPTDRMVGGRLQLFSKSVELGRARGTGPPVVLLSLSPVPPVSTFPCLTLLVYKRRRENTPSVVGAARCFWM